MRFLFYVLFLATSGRCTEQWHTLLDKSETTPPNLAPVLLRLIQVECDEHMMRVRFYTDYEHSQMNVLQHLNELPKVFNAIPITSRTTMLPAYCGSRSTGRGYLLLEFPLGECDGIESRDIKSGTVSYENRVQIVVPLDARLLQLQGGHATFDIKCTLQQDQQLFNVSNFDAHLLALNVDKQTSASSGGHFLDDLVALESSDVVPVNDIHLALAKVTRVQGMPFNCQSSGTWDKLVTNGCPSSAGVSKVFGEDALYVSRVLFRVPLSIDWKKVRRLSGAVVRLTFECSMMICTGSHLYALAGIPKCPYNDYCVPSVVTEDAPTKTKEVWYNQKTPLIQSRTSPIAVITSAENPVNDAPQSQQCQCDQVHTTAPIAHDTLTVVLISILSFILGALLVATVWCLYVRQSVRRSKLNQLMSTSDKQRIHCSPKYSHMPPDHGSEFDTLHSGKPPLHHHHLPSTTT